MILNRESILASKVETREVDAHEWGATGDTVLVRALNLKEANEWRRSMLRPVTKVDPKSRAVTTELQFNEEAAETANAWMTSIAGINPDGTRLFTPADVEALSGISLSPIVRIAKAVMEISGLSATAADDAEKN